MLELENLGRAEAMNASIPFADRRVVEATLVPLSNLYCAIQLAYSRKN